MLSVWQIRDAFIKELIAFGLSEHLSPKDAVALQRRIDLIAKAALDKKPMPKSSKRFEKAMRDSLPDFPKIRHLHPVREHEPRQ